MGIYEQLKTYMENNVNVLLMGPHGVGKTTMVKDIAKELGLRLKYYSSATLDPWADLVGIPVPDGARERVNFLRPRAVDNAEIIFFDELNRAHSKVQDAVLEIIQYHSINGEKLPHLRMCWAAINPSDSRYNVTEMDEVLMDRFHIHLNVPARVDKHYLLSKGYNADTVTACVEWWKGVLNDEARRYISPRRLEYLIQHIERSGVDSIEDVIPFSIKKQKILGLRTLVNAIKGNNDDITTVTSSFTINRNDLVANAKQYADALNGDNAVIVASAIVDCLTTTTTHLSTFSKLFEAKVLQNMPLEFQYHLIHTTKLKQRLQKSKTKSKKQHGIYQRMLKWIDNILAKEAVNKAAEG